jgi:hypothetical protein
VGEGGSSSTEDTLSEKHVRGGFGNGLNKRAAISLGFVAMLAVICIVGGGIAGGPINSLGNSLILQEKVIMPKEG